ncbi:MAG: serine/threonine-protein kinase [bacterium]|nr:serine/threonine-protein kinase [bacterium]
MPAERNPDLVLAAFYDAVLHDRESGRGERRLADYQARFPGYENEIARAWAEIAGGEAAGAGASGADGIDPGPGANGGLVAGVTFAGYRIDGVLGRGGQAIVYDAFDADLDRPVALKVLHGSRLWSPDARARFAREVELTVRLAHPGICPVHARGFENGVPWVAMRRLEGQPLGALPESGDWRVAVRRVRDAADAVAHAHERHVIHRDLKPANLWVDEDGRVLVLDFGLAADLRGEVTGASEQAGLTLTGDQFGTPGYMAPEQLGHGGRTSPATDVFALGVVLFERVAGQRPFDTATMMSYERAVLVGPPELRRIRSGLPRDLDALLQVAMASSPVERYLDAAALRDDLDALLAGRPIQATAPGRLLRLWRWAQRERALAVTILTLFCVLVSALVTVSMALARSQRDAATSALTATAALLGNEEFELARARLRACPEEHRGFAFAVLARELDNGLDPVGQSVAREAPAIVTQRVDGRLQVRAESRAGDRAFELPLPATVEHFVLALSSDASLVALSHVRVGHGGTRVRVFGTEDGRERYGLELPRQAVTALAFSRDGRWLWTAARRIGVLPRNVLQAWSTLTGERLLARDVRGPRLRSLIAIDDRHLAVGRDDGLVQLVPLDRSLDIVNLGGHRATVGELHLTGRGFSSRCEAGEERHWDRFVRGSGRTLETGGQTVHALRWRDAKTVEVWSPYHRLAIWTPAAQVLHWLPEPEPPAASAPRAEHPSEDLVVVGTADGRVSFESGAEVLFSLRSGAAAVTAAAFSPDGNMLAVGHADGTVIVWAGSRSRIGPAAAVTARERAFERLASVGHEMRLLADLTDPAVDEGWAMLGELQLCRRRSGRVWDELRVALRQPVAPRGLWPFVQQELTALRTARPELWTALAPEAFAFARCGQFDTAASLLQQMPDPQMTAVLQSALAGLRRPTDNELPAGLPFAEELGLRAQPSGEQGWSWLQDQVRRGVPWHQLGKELPDDRAVAQAVERLLALTTRDPRELTDACVRLAAWPDPPLVLKSALAEWTLRLVAEIAPDDFGAAAIRVRVARGAALLRDGDSDRALAMLAPLVARATDWRDADAEAVAFYALALQAAGRRIEALTWRDCLTALVANPSQRNRQLLDVLRRELDRRGL